jgi:putative ABC transport system permease protein
MITLFIKQRKKEFGIRKVLGAGIADIIRLTAGDFVWVIVLATAIATPPAWYLLNKWLQNFAYRIEVSWWVFAVCGLSILIVTISTISFQAIKAAMANPVKSLKTE